MGNYYTLLISMSSKTSPLRPSPKERGVMASNIKMVQNPNAILYMNQLEAVEVDKSLMDKMVRIWGHIAINIPYKLKAEPSYQGLLKAKMNKKNIQEQLGEKFNMGGDTGMQVNAIITYVPVVEIQLIDNAGNWYLPQGWRLGYIVGPKPFIGCNICPKPFIGFNKLKSPSA
ncbi:hypothetical protein M8C21_027067 [Ambrosia artemisiifolia]|uniref:Uncharacterized protein n=1 Tax=Ambrosia artemisiifolia TaxID=4212 RepID=A0AAD5CPK3_AMBAR|nr:hypothetical protein M8C21_027067 [Ambrosia artemisiifolia]